MMNPLMTADDVSKVLSYSRSHAYKVIGKLNQELEEKGFLTRPGMVSRKYFEERTGLEIPQEGGQANERNT